MLPEPSPGQRRQIARKYGMFCHYGMNTYLEAQWSDGAAAAGVFDPPGDLAVKVDGWAALAKKAGMRYLLLTAKHHDGFCLWPTKLTGYHSLSAGVSNKVDVVEAVAEACRRHGVEFGIYYSLWDRHEPSYKDADSHKYIEWMKGQLRELLTGYGEVCELWLDGQWDRKREEWFLPEVYAFVKGLQPGCQVGVNHTMEKDPKLAQEGEELTYWPSDFRLFDPYLPGDRDPKIFTAGGEKVYLPFEATVTMSPLGNWFAHAGDPYAWEVDMLEEIFYRVTRQDNLLVLNVSPDKAGEIFPATRKNLTELGMRLGIGDGAAFGALREPRSLTYGALASTDSIVTENGVAHGPENAVDGDPNTCWMGDERAKFLEVKLRRAGRFNCVVIVESSKARIGRFAIEVENGMGEWETVCEGARLSDPAIPTPSFGRRGYAKLVLPRVVMAQKVRLTILNMEGVATEGRGPAIYCFGLHLE